MNRTEYFTLADGYGPGSSPSNWVSGSATNVAPSNVKLLNYTIAADGYTNWLDMRNVQQLGVLCSFLSGSTLAGTLVMQVSNDREAPDNSAQPVASPNYINVTAPSTTLVTIVSGAQNVAYDYPLVGHRWVRLYLHVTSGTGAITFAYNLRSA